MTFYETLDQGRAFLLLLYAGMAAGALYDLTALFRAPETCEAYYDSLVSQDLSSP